MHCSLCIIDISYFAVYRAIKKKKSLLICHAAPPTEITMWRALRYDRRSRSAIRIRIDRKTNDKTMVAEHVVIVVPYTLPRGRVVLTGLGYRVSGRPPVCRTICRSSGVIVFRAWTEFERRPAFVGENAVFEKNVFAGKNENYFER